MPTKTKTPTLDEVRARAAAAAAALAEAEAIAAREAEEATAKAQAERLDRSERIVAAVDDVEAVLSDRSTAAAKARQAAVSALDLQAILDTEVAYQAATMASNLWRARFNAAVHFLTHLGLYTHFTRPADKPERRERPVNVFAPGDTSTTLLARAIHARADVLAEDVLAEVLADLGLADLVEAL